MNLEVRAFRTRDFLCSRQLVFQDDNERSVEARIPKLLLSLMLSLLYFSAALIARRNG